MKTSIQIERHLVIKPAQLTIQFETARELKLFKDLFGNLNGERVNELVGTIDDGGIFYQTYRALNKIAMI